MKFNKLIGERREISNNPVEFSKTKTKLENWRSTNTSIFCENLSMLRRMIDRYESFIKY